MKGFNNREKRWFSIILSSFGIFLVISGIALNSSIKPIVTTKLTVMVERRQIAASQAKSNEIKIKNIEIEINNPISTDVKDYLEDIDNLNEDTIKSLKLDTSLVNINEAGDYQYKIIYNKKEFIGTIKIKEKELPNMLLTLKTIKLNTNEALSQNPRSFINETITDEVYNHIILDLSEVDTTVQGDYTYYLTYKDVTYQGKVEIRDPAPTIIVARKDNDKDKCPDNSKKENNTCVCNDNTKTYDSKTNTCK